MNLKKKGKTYVQKPQKLTKQQRAQGYLATTENFSAVLREVEKTDGKFFNELLDCVNHQIEQYEKMAVALNDSPESRAWNWNRNTSQIVDMQLEKDLKGMLKREVSCKKGCAWCCGQNVTITDDEAMLLVKREKEQNRGKIDWERAESQAKEDFTPDKFAILPWERRACPMLDLETNLCTNYDDRPGICRTHYTLDDPMKCKTDVRQVMEKFVPFWAEANVSASWNVRETGPMPLMLLKAKKQLEEGNNASISNAEINENS